MKTIHILAPGPGIENYEKPKDQIITTIGVNDIFRYHPVNYLLLMDQMHTFGDRVNIIKNSTPDITLSPLEEWQFMPGYIKLNLANVPGSIEQINDTSVHPYHVDTTFTAACLAYKMGAKRIEMYGVHFYGHHLMEYKKEILSAYQTLYSFLLSQGIELFVQYNSSLLAQVIPFLQHDFDKVRLLQRNYVKRYTPEPLTPEMDETTKSEHDKYSQIWNVYVDYSSPNVVEFAKYVFPLIENGRSLEIGCGDGQSVKWLNDNFRVVMGLDITLSGVKKRVGEDYFNSRLKSFFVQSPVWRMPFGDNAFHYTFSTDVLEHIPPQQVEESIKEIIRITSNRTIHVIADFEAREYFGHKVHLTVKPLAWWKTIFEMHNEKGLEIELMSWHDFQNKVLPPGNTNKNDATR